METVKPANYSFELLADYVEGFVDRETAERIEQHLESDEVSREIVEGIKYWYRENGTDREGLEEYLENFKEQLSSRISTTSSKLDKTDQKTRSTGTNWLRIAAAVLLVAGVTAMAVRFTGASTDRIVTAALEDTYRAPSTSRGAEESQLLWEQFKQEWASKEFGQATATADAITNPSDEQVFYQGMARLYDENWSEAALVLQHVSGTGSEYAEQARWYMALALYQKGDPSFARGILEKIADDPGHFKNREAEKLLKSGLGKRD